MRSDEWTNSRQSFDEDGAISDSRIPILIWIVLIYGASLALQLIDGDFHWINLLFFTGLIALHASLYWHSPSFVVKRAWIYFLIQGLLVYAASYLVPTGSPVVLIGLYPALISQSTGVFNERSKIVLVSLGCYSLMLIALGAMDRSREFALIIPVFVLLNVIVVSYGLLFFRQVRAKLRTQSFLRELERTHRRVEELTLANERQRMARDLHDTLAQGLAGLLMQLEAADAHLDKANPERAQDIIKKAMERARSTLSEARLVIDDLRQNGGTEAGDGDFVRLVGETADKLTAHTPLSVSLNSSPLLPLSRFVMEHCLYIVGECIANAVKHAEAKRLCLTIEQDPRTESLRLVVQDDGIGFHVGAIGQRSGHYGLVGIRERIRLLGGEAEISSAPGKGTTIEVRVPGRKGEKE
ncbi:sensor histidine kinase [Cohnella sp.]|uniref:sensor histidine kinase n=1 Tax=Cohnella sp. TaxID=1883426 RepID=UPI00356503B6